MKLTDMNAIEPELATRLAHELRSPLSVIVGGLSHTRRDPQLPAVSAKMLELATRSCARLERLARRLDLIARAQLHAASAGLSNKLESTHRHANGHGPRRTLQEVLEDVCERAQVECPRANVELSLAPVPAFEVSSRLSQALELAVDELVHNAIRFADQSVVVAATIKSDEAVRVSVRDDGPGFTAQARTRGCSLHPLPSSGLGWGLWLANQALLSLDGSL